MENTQKTILDCHLLSFAHTTMLQLTEVKACQERRNAENREKDENGCNHLRLTDLPGDHVFGWLLKASHNHMKGKAERQDQR